MKVVFLSKDGTTRIEEMGTSGSDNFYPKTITKPRQEPSEQDVVKLARGIFDRKHSKEAIVRGEGNVQKALDAMWNKTKLDSQLACLQEAIEILSLTSEDRIYQMVQDYNAPGGFMYVERGTVLVDWSRPNSDAKSSGDYVFRPDDYGIPKNTERGKKSPATAATEYILKDKRDWDKIYALEDDFLKELDKRGLRE